MKKTLILLSILVFTLYSLSAQEEASRSDSLRKDALNVYMDASSYIKQHIPFINYVRDRKVADLIIIL
ncbi:MAG: hypothetical protein U9N72_04775 [Bacteroidota bacterium]|nr:hypothetical protein [Bacteroidota bacterium]